MRTALVIVVVGFIALYLFDFFYQVVHHSLIDLLRYCFSYSIRLCVYICFIDMNYTIASNHIIPT